METFIFFFPWKDQWKKSTKRDLKTRKKNRKRDHKRDWRKSRNGKKHSVCVYACTCPLALLPVPPRPLLLFLLDGIGSGSPQDLRGNIKHRIISEPPPSHPFPLARSPSHQHRHSFSSTAKSSESCLNPCFFPSSVSPCRQERAQVWLIG